MASVILDRLKTELENRLAVGPNVEIAQALSAVPGAGELLKAASGAAALAVSQASLSVSDEVLTVRGMAAVLDATPIPVEIQFRDDGGLIFNLEGRVPALTPLAEAAAGRFLKGKFAVPSGLIKFRIKTVSVTVTTATRTALVVFADTGDTEVADLLTIRQPRLSLAATGLDQDSPTVVAHFEGLLVIANVLFAAKGQLGGNSGFSITPASEDLLLTTEQLLNALLGTAIPRFPNLPVSDLQMIADLGAGDITIVAALAGTWGIPLGVNPPELTGITITVSKMGASVTGRVEGRMSIAGQPLTVQAAVPGELTLSGELPSLNLTDLARELAGPVLAIPAGIPGLRLEASRFTIRFGGDMPTFTVQTTVNDFGTIGVIVANVSGGWQALAVFATPADFRFSRLAPVLAPLDVLRIGSPRLAIASFDSDNFPIPSVGGIEFPSRVRKGVLLEAALTLRGRGLDFVASLLGVDELPLRLAAAGDLAASEVSAALGGTKVLVPGVLTLENIDLAFVPTPFAVTLRSEAQLVIEGEALPRFRIAVGLSEATQKISLETTEAWVKPFGISGLTIRKVILDVQTAPTPAYGVLGDIEIAGRVIRIAGQFVSSAPSALVGELQGRLSLGEVLHDLVAIGLPPVLDLSIEDFSLQIVSNPLGATIGSVHFEPGLSLRGTLGILGLEMLVNVRVRPETGVFASGSLKRAVEFGNVLTISNAAGDGPPSMLLDTTSSPMLKLDGRLTLLGLTETIEASVDRSGFSVRLRRSLGIGRYDLDTKFESVQQFRAAGSFEFGLSATIRTDIGNIVLDTGCSGSVVVTMLNGAFELVADGGFTFVGNTLDVPTLRITTAIDSLESLPPRIRDLVVEKAQDIFKSVLEDPGKWVQAIAANGIREVENVAKILKDRFGKDAAYIGNQLKTVLNRSSLEVGQALKGIGEAPERIASLLRDLGDQAPNVRDTLTRLGVPADQISQIMQDSFPSIPHLDQNVHTDIHADSPLIPPVNIRVNTPVIPPVNVHIDRHAIPRVNNHVDRHAIPRVNNHIDRRGPGVSVHVDRRIAGVHADRHTDSPGPHLDTHTDTPGQAHVDIHTDTPGRVHVDTHTDTPGQAHVDTHTDTPGQAQVNTHTDASVHTDAP